MKGARCGRRLVGVSIIVVGALVVPVLEAMPSPASSIPGLKAADLRLLHPSPTTLELPANPHRALISGVAALSARLGVRQDPAALVTAARLSPGVAARLAVLVDRLLDCQVASEEFDAAPPARREASGAELRACAARLQEAGLWVARTLRGAEGEGAVDVWPVLHYDPGTASDRYENDYALIVDAGGNDTYLNNAGGNLLDVKRGPKGVPSPEPGPARGCRIIILDLSTGDCVVGSALLIDSAGDDTYGQRETPDPRGDGNCTRDPVVPRLGTAGAGFSGVGILIDGEGADHYVGKTVTQGMGHSGGVGILLDDGIGDDSYLAIRNAQGLGIAGGLGVLRDQTGNDTYGWYQPRAIDPAAPFQRAFSGGVIDELGRCDSLPRAYQGIGIAGGVGVLYDGAGDDTYRAAPASLQDNAVPGVNIPSGSQGWGFAAGFGMLDDESGHDTYEGMPGRSDGVTLHPSQDNTGLFVDKA